MATRHQFQVDGHPHTVLVDEVDGRLTVAVDGGAAVEVDATTPGAPGLFSIIRGGVPSIAYVVREGRNLRVIVEGRTFLLGPAGVAGRQRGVAGGAVDRPGRISAPLAGVVVDIRTAAGDRIEPRQTVVVIEAMKMQNEVQAPLAGLVTAIRCQQGVRVGKGDLLIEYTPDGA